MTFNNFSLTFDFPKVEQISWLNILIVAAKLLENLLDGRILKWFTISANEFCLQEMIEHIYIRLYHLTLQLLHLPKGLKSLNLQIVGLPTFVVHIILVMGLPSFFIFTHWILLFSSVFERNTLREFG